MKKVLLFCLVAASAFAGERLLGRISEISTTKSNLSQSPDASQQWSDGGYEMPFCIPEMAFLTVVCNVPESICTDKTACTALEGVPVSNDVLFPTSVGASKGVVEMGPNPDGGALPVGGYNAVRPCRSAAVSIFNPGADGGYHYCTVWERTGKE